MPSIRNFVSHVAEPALLQQFLNSHSISLAADFLSGPSKSVAEGVEQALENLPAGKRTQLTHQIETVERMSTEAG